MDLGDQGVWLQVAGELKWLEEGLGERPALLVREFTSGISQNLLYGPSWYRFSKRRILEQRLLKRGLELLRLEAPVFTRCEAMAKTPTTTLQQCIYHTTIQPTLATL